MPAILIRRWSTAAIAFVVACATSVPTAIGQNEPVGELPSVYEPNSVSPGETAKSWLTDVQKAVDPRWPDRVLERYADELSRGQHGKVLRALSDEFRLVKWPSSQDALAARFQRRMDAVAAAFATAQAQGAADGALDTLEARDKVLAKFNATRTGTQSLLPELATLDQSVGPVLVFFAGTLADPDDTSEMIVTYRPKADNTYELLVPFELMLDLRLRAEAVRRVTDDYVKPVQDRAFDAIKKADRQWRNYLENGYSQYPWESFVNGKLWNFSAFEPPTDQLIFLHPALGIEASTVSLDQLTANESLNVEILGYLHYYGDDHEHFLGASIAASLQDQIAPGLGLVVHWTKSFSVGVSWHDIDDNGNPFNDTPYLFLSFDLYRYLQSEGSQFKGEYDRIRALMPH